LRALHWQPTEVCETLRKIALKFQGLIAIDISELTSKIGGQGVNDRLSRIKLPFVGD
jgi:hypothetical protein